MDCAHGNPRVFAIDVATRVFAIDDALYRRRRRHRRRRRRRASPGMIDSNASPVEFCLIFFPSA